jgi:Ca-activated chloride channel family protein
MEASLDVLSPLDTISIVTYSGEVGVALPPTPASDVDTIRRAIRDLAAYGSTRGGAAINLAYQQAEDGFIEGGFNHVVMMTDGDFNVGITDDDALVALIEEKRRSGVTLTALGFGRGNLNDAMMERVSNAGNGTYTVITSESHAQEYAAGPLLAGVHLVAQDMKIQVEFNPEHVRAYRLLGYENRAIADEDFRVDSVDAGEVGAGHQVTALYELVLTGQEIPSIDGAPLPLDGERVMGDAEIGTDELVQVRVRWKDLGASETDPAYETSASLAPTDVGRLSAADGDHQWAAAIAAFAEILKESPYAQVEDLDHIGKITEDNAGTDEDRVRFRELFERARTLLGY